MKDSKKPKVYSSGGQHLTAAQVQWLLNHLAKLPAVYPEPIFDYKLCVWLSAEHSPEIERLEVCEQIVGVWDRTGKVTYCFDKSRALCTILLASCF